MPNWSFEWLCECHGAALVRFGAEYGKPFKYAVAISRVTLDGLDGGKLKGLNSDGTLKTRHALQVSAALAANGIERMRWTRIDPETGHEHETPWFLTRRERE